VEGQNELEEDEGDEEAYESEWLSEMMNETTLIEKRVSKESWEKEKKEREKCFWTHYEETEMLLCDFHIDILMLLYRCEIKLDKEFNIL